MENRGDLGHAVYLHGRLFQYALEREGKLTDDPKARYNAQMAQQEELLRRGVYTKYRPIYNQFSFTKGTLISGQAEDANSWNVGSNPILFPYMLAFGPGIVGIRQLVGCQTKPFHSVATQHAALLLLGEAGDPRDNTGRLGLAGERHLAAGDNLRRLAMARERNAGGLGPTLRAGEATAAYALPRILGSSRSRRPSPRMLKP